MKLTDLLTDDMIAMDVHGATKEDIIVKLVDILEHNHFLLDRTAFEEAVFRREQEGTTGIGFGIAIPHGKSDAVKTPAVVFGKSAQGVNWDSLDGEPVHLIFLIAVPEKNAGDEHLKILQMLSRKLIDDSFRASLLQASTRPEVLQLLNSIA